MPTQSANDGASDPIISFTGERVAMGPLHADLIPLFTRWENNLDSLIIGGDELVVQTPERLSAIFKKLIDEEHKDRVFFALYDRESLQPIGWCNIREIDTFYQCAEIGIAIGLPEFRGRGYGSEAVALLCDYGFTAFGLNNIMLDTVAFNERAIRAYEKAGFKLIGRRRDGHRIGNLFYDQVLMDCLARDFYATRTSIFSIPAGGRPVRGTG